MFWPLRVLLLNILAELIYAFRVQHS